MNEQTPTTKKTILLVEDDRFIRELIQKTIVNQGMTVLIAATGTEAITQLDKHKNAIDLILMDIILPDKNGYEILEYMQEDKTMKSVPVIVLSNLGEEEEIKRAKALGVKEYMVKAHYDINDILAVIRKYV